MGRLEPQVSRERGSARIGHVDSTRRLTVELLMDNNRQCETGCAIEQGQNTYTRPKHLCPLEQWDTLSYRKSRGVGMCVPRSVPRPDSVPNGPKATVLALSKLHPVEQLWSGGGPPVWSHKA